MPPIAGAQETADLVTDTLPALLERGANAFSAGNFTEAAEIFSRIDEHFSNEPAYQEGQLTQRLFPLWGFAEMRAGAPSRAAMVFERFLKKHPDDEQEAFVLYGLGTALRQANKLEEALQRLSEYEERFPARTETSLARLQRSEILFQLSREEEATALLIDFSESSASLTLRTQARLRALQHAVAQRQLELTARLLFDFPWEDHSMPETAVLGFAAMEAGDLFLGRGDGVSALRAYRMVLPRKQLIEAQEERLEEVRQIVHQSGRQGGAGYRHDYYLGLGRRMQQQLAALEEGEDYTPSLLLRRGQAYLLADRGREAWLILESLSFDESLSEEIRQEAHYRWILAANSLEEWEEALAIARNYLERYPSSPLIAEALFLMAQAHSERRRHDEAIEVLTDLLDQYPGHPLRQRWLFSRGFNTVLLDRYEEARPDFRAAAEADDSTPLGATSLLWEALTWFFAREYETAVEHFARLEETFSGHPLEGEVVYRKASTLYAMREYEQAIAEAGKFLESFQRHQREPEAHILMGNIYMDSGELDLAFEAFAQVPPEFKDFYSHAVFQQGKILQANQDYQEMVAHFGEYLELAEENDFPRISEALYWIGWAYSRRGHPERAFPIYLHALTEHGNSPEAGEIDAILTALHRLHGELSTRADVELSSTARRLTSAADFEEWLEQERRGALEEGKPTYFAHLSLNLASIARRNGESARRDALLFEIAERVQIEQLPASALAQVGLHFTEHDLRAGQDHFEHLLRVFPNSPERAHAYFGLGQSHFKRGEFAEALLWLRRFQQETPAHDLSGRAGLLTGETLLRLTRPDEAAEILEDILQHRQHRGRIHAKALIGLGEAMEQLDEKEKAIAYYQRVYTLYRAFDDLIGTAYFRSGNLFAAIGDRQAARNSFQQFSDRRELHESPHYDKAMAILADLPEDAENEVFEEGETQ